MRTKMSVRQDYVYVNTYWYADPWYNPGAYRWERVEHLSTRTSINASDYDEYHGLSFGPENFFDICPEEFPF